MAIMATVAKKDNPCFGCEARKIGCHGKCVRYEEFKKKLEELRFKERGYRIYRSTKTIEIYETGYTTKRSGKKTTLKAIEIGNKNK